ncbi:MAG: DUF5317 family protein [Candidatus Limnocylindria bacterium]
MLASAVALGVAAGLAFGGDWRRLARVRIRAWPLLAAAFAIRAVGFAVPLPPALYLAALAAIVAVALLNARLPGALLVAFGTALNVAVIALNGGMPVDAAAALAAGAEQRVGDGLHVPLTDTTLLPFLADVIPVPLVRGVYSAGDVVIALGGFWLPFAALRRP